MEYIPKDKVLELWRYWKFIEAYDQVKAMPGIEIVRCKDCRYNYGNENNCGFNPEDILCTYHASDGFDANDFCSYGERRK